MGKKKHRGDDGGDDGGVGGGVGSLTTTGSSFGFALALDFAGMVLYYIFLFAFVNEIKQTIPTAQ